jgi:F420-non-reducing hydrogenase iron-sulfur subunit
MSDQFEPVIVGLLCNWCSYRAADLAGMSRIHYAPNLRIMRVMCSARVDPQFVLKALRTGADGVMVAGCHPGECHYVDGNMKAMRRFIMLKRVLAQLGVEDERVQLLWASASEGNILAEAVTRMTEQVRALGPLRWDERVLGGDGPMTAESLGVAVEMAVEVPHD